MRSSARRPPVEWKTRQQIEDGQYDVDSGKPSRHFTNQWHPGPREKPNDSEDRPQGKAREWTHQSHPEFVERAARLLANLRSAAEDEQRDPGTHLHLRLRQHLRMQVCVPASKCARHGDALRL
jgi:hypothetical protein